MNKPELEGLLEELDGALASAFPGQELMRMLVVGGACLLFQGVTARPTEDVDVIIFEMMGSEETTLIYRSPVADKIRRLIKAVGNLSSPGYPEPGPGAASGEPICPFSHPTGALSAF